MDDSIDVRSQEFSDDSSRALDLSHSATSAKGGGSRRYFERLEAEHLRIQAEEMKRQGVDSPEKLRPSNHGAYDAITARISELHRNGMTYREATRQAVEENPDKVAADIRSDHRDYLGDATIESLMGTDRRVHAGGGGGNVTKIRQEPVFEPCPTCYGLGFRSEDAFQADLVRRPGMTLQSIPPCPKCGGEGRVKTGTRTVQVQMMGAKSAGGGGGGSGKMKRGKRGGMGGGGFEAPILASYYGADGRYQVIEDEARSEHRSGRVTPTNDQTLEEIEGECGVNTAGILAAVAIMRRSEDPNAQLAFKIMLGLVPEAKRKGAA